MNFKFIFISFIINNCVKCGKQRIKVSIDLGDIWGTVETPFKGKTLHVFKGIPYAQPPIESLRFRKPVPITRDSTPVQAFQYSCACVQNVSHNGVGDNLLIKCMSEDCLYLNIW